MAAVALDASSLKMKQSRLARSTALSDIEARGGGLSLTNTQAQLNEVVFHSCTASAIPPPLLPPPLAMSAAQHLNGGGLGLVDHSYASMANVSFINCSALESGGGFWAATSAFDVTHSIFDANHAPHGAAFMYASAPAVDTVSTIRRSGFQSNAGGPTVSSAFPVTWACQPGQWMAKTGDSYGDFEGCAQRCAAGFYGGDDDNAYTIATCKASCPTGHYCVEGSDQPTACPAGTRMPTTGAASNQSCIPCAPGSRQPLEGQTECVSCPVGKFVNSLGASSCNPCPVGGFCATVGAASASMTFEQCPGAFHTPHAVTTTTPWRPPLTNTLTLR